jgi:cellulose synthase/poly-beta-1,6-N-acetylglucosamine synthase-like glycosyltransferase
MDFLDWKINLGLLLFGVFTLITLIQLIYHWLFFSRLAFFKAADKSKPQTQPVSVIVCARDEAANLATNLQASWFKLIQPHEVIVVNDNSVDESKYVIAELQKVLKISSMSSLSMRPREFQVRNTHSQ